MTCLVADRDSMRDWDLKQLANAKRIGVWAVAIGVWVALAGGAWAEGVRARVVLPQWRFSPGALNSITDVLGVKVGQVTVVKNGAVVIRTGVTAIIPHSGNLATEGVWASGRMLNGNGELTGLDFIRQSGLLTSPIVLTNTFSVGAADTGVFQYFLKHYPGKAAYTTQWSGLLPVVGECYDGYFNTIEALDTLKPEDTMKALETARSGSVAQGRVGAGAGMRTFGLHGGIGTASRVVTVEGKPYTIGVLVNANHSRFEEMLPQIRQVLETALHKPLAQVKLEDERDQVQHPQLATPSRQGSIMVVIATDLPLMPTYLDEIGKRAALGIGAMGSTMNTTSGDGVVVFSTAQRVAVGDAKQSVLTTQTVHPDALNEIFRASVEGVTEAQINAILNSHENNTVDNNNEY